MNGVVMQYQYSGTFCILDIVCELAFASVERDELESLMFSRLAYSSLLRETNEPKRQYMQGGSDNDEA